jgi:hypothetical protein
LSNNRFQYPLLRAEQVRFVLLNIYRILVGDWLALLRKIACKLNRLSAYRAFVTALVLVISGSWVQCFSQQFPSVEENIPYLITFGRNGATSWGDDDFSQTFFLSVPKSQKDPIYIRVFDPDVGGLHDEMKGDFNTKFKFTIYGGIGAFSPSDAKNADPKGNYDGGTVLFTKSFGVDPKYDNNWYTFGPINPTEGEYTKSMDAYVFKVIAEGISGDDGNIYKYFLSTKPDRELKIEGANAFTYEYTFRLPNNPTICHIYPFVNKDVISIEQYNFDWDGDGMIRLVSIARKGEPLRSSLDDQWAITKHEIFEREKNTSLDIQLIKSKSQNNNNVVFRVTNHYGEALPFFSIPIGGPPKYMPIINVRPDPK